MNVIDKILATREGGSVLRCHTLPYHGAYNVAMHSYNALSLLLLLYPVAPSLQLIKATLWHDVHERWIGDIPSPAGEYWMDLKIAKEDLAAQLEDKLELLDFVLTPNEHNWLTQIDYLELFLWVKDQVSMGNQTLAPMQRKMLDELTKRKERNKLPREIVSFISNFVWKRLPDCNEFMKEE